MKRFLLRRDSSALQEASCESFRLLKLCPRMASHASTQTNVTQDKANQGRTNPGAGRENMPQPHPVMIAMNAMQELPKKTRKAWRRSPVLAKCARKLGLAG